MNFDEIESHLKQFEKEFELAPKVLRRGFVEPFIQKIKEAPSCPGKEQIESQAKEIRLLQKMYLEEEHATKRKWLSYRELLTPYPDLLKRADTCITREYSEPFSLGAILTQEIREKIEALFKEFYKKGTEELLRLVERSKEVKKKIVEINQFRSQVPQMLDAFHDSYDLKNEVDAYKKHFLTLFKDKITSSAIDEAYASYLLQKKEVEDAVEMLSNRRKYLSKVQKNIIHTIKRRLLEIFSGVTPFPDLKEKIQALRTRLLSELKEQKTRFCKGGISLNEYRGHMLELAYDRDVLQVLGELAFRATRLRELRLENYRLLKDTLRIQRLLESVGAIHTPSYSEIAHLSKELSKNVHHLEDPFQLFIKADPVEQVNVVFRKVWVELEGLQHKQQIATESASLVLRADAEKIKKEFLKVLDDLEEILKETTGKRPNLVGFFGERLLEENGLELNARLQRQMEEVEKRYPFTQPLSFFMHVHDQRVRQQMLLEAKKLDAQVEEVILFAKTLQYVKVFDEERVDDILEVFEARYCIENQGAPVALWQAHKEYIEQVIPLVLEEILLDIGLLDMRALLDIDEKKLQKALYQAQDVAKRQIEPLTQELSQYPCKSERSFTFKVKEALIKELVIWFREKVDPEASSDMLLQKLLDFCHLLFGVRSLRRYRGEKMPLHYIPGHIRFFGKRLPFKG